MKITLLLIVKIVGMPIALFGVFVSIIVNMFVALEEKLRESHHRSK